MRPSVTQGGSDAGITQAGSPFPTSLSSQILRMLKSLLSRVLLLKLPLDIPHITVLT